MADVNKILDAMTAPEPRLYLLRGLPGSGKSTLAREMVEKGQCDVHYEADMYFMFDGKYHFEPKDLLAAHNWCLQSTRIALAMGKTVVVANTFVFKHHLIPYHKLCEHENCEYVEIICKGSFISEHNVPELTIARMARDFQL